MNEEQTGQLFSDVKPSTASPAAKPVIPSGVPQPDPMLAARPGLSHPQGAVSQPASMVEDQLHDPRSSAPVLGQSPIAPSMPVAPEAPHELQAQTPIFGEVKKPKAKKILFVLLILIFLGALGYGGWMYWQKQTSKGKSDTKITTKDTTPKDTTPDDTTSKIFTSKFAGFSVENASDWKSVELETTKDYADLGTDKATYSKVTFTVNDKQFLVFDANPGGRGGDCEPKATDKPFQKTNTCDSFSVLTLNKLPEANFPAGTLGTSVKNVYVSTYKYMGTAAGGDTTTYTLAGIETSNTTTGTTGVEPKVGEEKMGLYVPFSILNTKNGYIDIKIVDKDGKVTQLSDADLAKVEAMLKAFKLK